MKNTMMMENLYDLENGKWWTHLNELLEEIEELGFEIDEANREYIVVSTDGDYDEFQTFVLNLGGTERTIIIKEIKAIN